MTASPNAALADGCLPDATKLATTWFNASTWAGGKKLNAGVFVGEVATRATSIATGGMWKQGQVLAELV